MANRCLYNASFKKFLSTEKLGILGTLHNNFHGEALTTTNEAWKGEIEFLQMEYDVLPTKVLIEDKAEYIQALIDTREEEDIEIFIDCMTRLHCQHLKSDIDNFIASTQEEIGDKSIYRDKIVDKIKKTGDKLAIKGNVIDNLATILSYIDAHPHTKTDTLVKLIGKSPSTLKNYLSQLVDLELLESEGANKNRTYITK